MEWLDVLGAVTDLALVLAVLAILVHMHEQR